MSRKIYLPTLGVWEDVDDVTLLRDVPRVSSDGALINPATGARPAAGRPFALLGGAIGGLRITVPDAAASAETITITGTLRDGTTWTAAGTLAPGDSEDWPINRLGLASLSWASTGPSAYVEPM